MFYAGHSGTRFGAKDIPILRAMRDTYRKFIETARSIDWSQEGPGMVLAAATITAELQAKFDACGNVLDMLERTPPGWRP
jgi:hypothetical protein